MPFPDSVALLVQNFAENRSEYHQGHYNETQTRVDYVNPLFEALGWDMDNHDGLSELHREVIHEDMVKIGGHSKAPDYSFRAGGERKFFVETKKPSVNLYLLEAPAFQLRRYAWTVKMPLSILTNFEEFAVYDTRVRPDQKDPAKMARLEYFKYTDYADHWESLVSRFSRNAVLSGAFDLYAAEARDKRIAVPVDVAFLSEISGWREKLARNIVLNNPGLGPRALNYAVQMIIDRIIFLRISEDRGAEPDFLLHPLTNKGGPVYPRLLDIFRRADARYNSGLFHFDKDPKREAPDDVTPHLTIDDRPLKEIIASVYYPESPFEFSVFPADILGQVYEQFLGKVIRIFGKTAEVEEKPEVKKAGGVYYTPTYIVDYIVRNTVGKLVDGKTPAQVAKLTILDPACGSGSFLIGAYQFLLDWHLKYYLENDRAKHAKGKNATVYQFKKDAAGGEVWRLTTAEKKRILLANIYGVDIDTQAVEVTKLSLLLKVLEGESAELIDNTLSLYKERALPDLEHNIKCGNSLIGPDFYTDKDMALFDLDAQIKINTFDWHTGFPQVTKTGGFDAVIGNPPYIRIQTMKEWSPWDGDFYKAKYASAGKGNYDIYVVFVEKGLSLLNKTGRLGFILPHKFFNSQYGQPLRKIISDGQHLEAVVNFGDQQVFTEATTYTCILLLSKNACKQFEFQKVTDLAAWREARTALESTIPVSAVTEQDWNFTLGSSLALLEKLLQVPTKLQDLTARIFQGLKTSADKVYILEERSRAEDRVKVYSRQTEQEHWIESGLLHPLAKGGDSKPYNLIATNRLILFPYKPGGGPNALLSSAELQTQYPLAWDYLNLNKAYLEGRENGKLKGSYWYQYGRNQAIDVVSKSKLITPDIALRPSFSLDESGHTLFTGGVAGGYGILVSPEFSRAYILGLLNSKLTKWFIQQSSTQMRGGYLSYEARFIRHIPVHVAKPAEKAQHDKMVQLVERMLTLHKDKAAARLATEKNMLQVQIEATDTQIDKLVYALYGLTEDEIAVVEGTP